MRLYFIALGWLLCSTCSQAASTDTSLFLIPRPKIIGAAEGSFSFKHPCAIQLHQVEPLCARLLQNAIEKKYNIKPAITSSAGSNIRLVKATGVKFDSILKIEKLSLPFPLGDEGYIIKISNQGLQIIANKGAGLFYGVQTLIQLINANSRQFSIPCMLIYDKPDVQMRGWQDDISRGPIPSMEFLKQEIRRMASFKLNTFTLYTEHVFKLKKHPTIAPPDGITAGEIKELVNYAKNYHVEIIGNFQSFGHFANILKVPGYEELGENKSTLSPANEKSYQFLADVYSEIVPAYESKYFHINCDEVSLDSGADKAMVDSLGIEGVYACHINRIYELLKPYHKRLMIWGDVAIKYPGIIQKLPEDIIMVSWDYGALDSEEENILPFTKAGREFIVAPGISCWSRIYPDINRATINIYNYLRDGYKNKSLGFINTTWDDSGQNLFDNNWYSLTWGADCGWNAPLVEPVQESEKTRKKRAIAFNRSYNRIHFNTDLDISSLMIAVSELRNSPVKNCLSDGNIWKPLLPDHELSSESYEGDNIKLIKTIDSLSAAISGIKSSFQGNEAALLIFALKQVSLVVNKNLLGIRLKNYIKSDTLKGNSYFQKDFAALTDTIKALRFRYGNLWQRENRSWWLDTVFSYYDSFASKLNDLRGVCLIKASDKLIDGKREIRLRSAFNELPVCYTTDGTIPDLNSLKYSGPLYLDSNVLIQARVIENDRLFEVQRDSLLFHKGLGALYKLNCRWNKDNFAYAARGEYGLVDGRKGSTNNFNDGRWQAYLGEDVNIELDFGKAIPINKITIGFAQLTRYGILFPKKIDVLSSVDGTNYFFNKSMENTFDPKIEERLVSDFTIHLDDAISRYIKIVAQNSGPLPEWHYARGKSSWLFADEIIIE